jgi:hypothetical protein
MYQAGRGPGVLTVETPDVTVAEGTVAGVLEVVVYYPDVYTPAMAVSHGLAPQIQHIFTLPRYMNH